MAEAPSAEDPLACLLHMKNVDKAGDASRESYAKILAQKSPDQLRWWSKDTVALVTGANRGIGLEIIRRLATEGMTTVLTARDESKGLAAVNALTAQGLENIHFHVLDVTDPDSVTKLTNWIKDKFGGLDILVSNAGVAVIDVNYQVAKYTVGTNYFGQRTVITALLPLLRPSPAGARIVLISSDLGQFQYLKNEKVKQRLSDIDHLTAEDLDALANKFLDDVKAGSNFTEWTSEGFPQYNESKLLLNAYGRVLANALSSRPEGNKVYVNAMTPGFTSTDLNGHHPGGRSVEDGSDTAVWIALFPSESPTGGFFKDRADFPF